MSYPLDPALFPRRGYVDRDVRAAAEAVEWGRHGTRPQRGTIEALAEWVDGGVFHPYGRRKLDALCDDLSVGDALRELHARKPVLKIDGELRPGGGTRWHVFYSRVANDGDEWGGCSGYSTPQDAAYACLTAIEEQEREAYEEALVLGVA